MKRTFPVLLILILSFSCVKESKDEIKDYTVEVVTLNVTNITEFKATLNGSISVKAKKPLNIKVGFLFSDKATCLDELKAYGEYYESELLEDGSFKSSFVPFGGKSTIERRLKDGTKYYYAAFATIDEQVIYGEMKTFSTLSIMVSLSTIEATEVTEFTAQLNGNLHVQSTEALQRDSWFIYSDTDSTLIGLILKGIKVETIGSKGESFYARLSKLPYKSKIYYVAASMVNGKSFYGKVKSFSTIELRLPESVDLGLSVKWRNWNLGANLPNEYGDYYAWGETSPKDNYSWDTYKWCNGSRSCLTKYCPANKADYWDGAENPDDKKAYSDYDYADDAARVILGGEWRTPTLDEWKELLDSCRWTATIDYKGSGIAGCFVTGRKAGYEDNSIFLPCAGYRNGIRFVYKYYQASGLDGPEGHYWASDVINYSGPPGVASCMRFLIDPTNSVSIRLKERGLQEYCLGLPIRPVTE